MENLQAYVQKIGRLPINVKIELLQTTIASSKELLNFLEKCQNPTTENDALGASHIVLLSTCENLLKIARASRQQSAEIDSYLQGIPDTYYAETRDNGNYRAILEPISPANEGQGPDSSFYQKDNTPTFDDLLN